MLWEHGLLEFVRNSDVFGMLIIQITPFHPFHNQANPVQTRQSRSIGKKNASTRRRVGTVGRSRQRPIGCVPSLFSASQCIGSRTPIWDEIRDVPRTMEIGGPFPCAVQLRNIRRRRPDNDESYFHPSRHPTLP